MHINLHENFENFLKYVITARWDHYPTPLTS